MIRFTGTASFDNLLEYASSNNCQLQKNTEKTDKNRKYAILDRDENLVHTCGTLKEVKSILEAIVKDRHVDSKVTEVIECKDIVDALKAVKENLSFHAAYKDTHKLYLAVHNCKLLAITDNGSEYAIATAPYINTNDEFYLVLPIERAIGFCRFLEVIRKQNKLNDFSYQLTDERLIAKCDGSKFEFNILPIEVFNITSDLRAIIDDFMGDADGYEVVDTYGTDAKPLAKQDNPKNSYSEQHKEKSHNHICFDGLFEYYFYNNCLRKSLVSNEVDLYDVADTGFKYRSKSELIGAPNTVLDWHHKYNQSGKKSPYPQAVIDYLYPLVYKGQSCDISQLEKQQPTMFSKLSSELNAKGYFLSKLVDFKSNEDKYQIHDKQDRLVGSCDRLSRVMAIVNADIELTKISDISEVESKPNNTNKTTDRSIDKKEIKPIVITPPTKQAIDNHKQESNMSIHNTEKAIEINNDTAQFVPGVGNIDSLPIDKLQVGMYLYFDNLLYTVSNIEQVGFINSDNSYIVTVNTLLDATKSQKILLSGNEQLAAWAVNFNSVVKPIESNSIKEDDTTEVKEVKRDKTEDCKVAKRNIKPAIDLDELPKPVRAATHDRGIKGSGRAMLIKMLSEGATLEQVMSSFNWSKKTASNHMTYVRQWGYNLELENKMYQVV